MILKVKVKLALSMPKYRGFNFCAYLFIFLFVILSSNDGLAGVENFDLEIYSQCHSLAGYA